jgi:hypothetical protein
MGVWTRHSWKGPDGPLEDTTRRISRYLSEIRHVATKTLSSHLNSPIRWEVVKSQAYSWPVYISCSSPGDVMKAINDL